MQGRIYPLMIIVCASQKVMKSGAQTNLLDESCGAAKDLPLLFFECRVKGTT